ncbi:MAG: cation diffusion facilitator family transporter, partial [Slackia sp.]|nr:cation diffusion facilitator family transporter [Slackia sp.]
NKPPDEKHPYGHGRFEYLSGLAVAVLILVIGVELIRSSFGKIVAPEPVQFSGALVAVLVLSIVVKLWMAAFNRSLGTRISSATLLATAADSRNDVIATAAVLVCTLLGEFGGVNVDGWAGLAVGAFIVYSGIDLIRDTIDPLLGKAPDPAFVQHIYDKITGYPGVIDTHDLIVHDYGPGRRFASAHVEMAAEMDPLESHDVIDNIEDAFRTQENLLLVLHYDPIVTSDAAVGDLRSWIATNIRRIDERLTIHDLRIVPGPTHTNVIFDVLRPAGLALGNDELAERISTIVREHKPDAVCKITVDDSYASPK